VSFTQSQRKAALQILQDVPDIDRTLPIWARRTNPIIRRQLGAHWRVFPPQVEPLIKWVVFQIALMLLTIPYSFLFLLILTAIVAAGVLLPYALYLYVRILANIINDVTSAMVAEYENDTLTLLRVAPFSALEIILSKMTAAIWRRADDLEQVLGLTVALTLPVVAAIYLPQWPPTEYPWVAQILSISALLTSLLRLPLEMFMVSGIAAMMSAATHNRSTAFLGTGVLVFFYFLLLNLPRLLSHALAVQFVLEIVLPLVLPLIFGLGALWATLRMVEHD